MSILGQESLIPLLSLLSSIDTQLGGTGLPHTETDPSHSTGVAHAGWPLTVGSKNQSHSFDKQKKN